MTYTCNPGELVSVSSLAVINHPAGLYGMDVLPNGKPFWNKRESIDKKDVALVLARTGAIVFIVTCNGHMGWISINWLSRIGCPE